MQLCVYTSQNCIMYVLQIYTLVMSAYLITRKVLSAFYYRIDAKRDTFRYNVVNVFELIGDCFFFLF